MQLDYRLMVLEVCERQLKFDNFSTCDSFESSQNGCNR